MEPDKFVEIPIYGSITDRFYKKEDSGFDLLENAQYFDAWNSSFEHYGSISRIANMADVYLGYSKDLYKQLEHPYGHNNHIAEGSIGDNVINLY